MEKIEEKKEKPEKQEKKEREKGEKEKEAKEVREGKRLEKVKEIVRILETDIPGGAKVGYGLTLIKGVSWRFASAICVALGIEKSREISSLTAAEQEKIAQAIKKPSLLPVWLLSRRRELATGKPAHLVTTELELAREFDIRRLRGIKSYRGLRHALGLPVRGQRTRGHFRRGAALGVQRAAKVAAKKAKEKEESKE